jgi:hypothetical protein
METCPNRASDRVGIEDSLRPEKTLDYSDWLTLVAAKSFSRASKPYNRKQYRNTNSTGELDNWSGGAPFNTKQHLTREQIIGRNQKRGAQIAQQGWLYRAKFLTRQ